jgi:putative glutamine amidotransferase
MKHNQPLIGITCDEDDKTSHYRSSKALPEAIKKVGGIPLLLPSVISYSQLKKLLTSLHGIVIAGGAFDIPPSFYGEKKRYRIDTAQLQRTKFEIRLIREAILQKKPILGICGGMQAINVALGGTLYQDISSELAFANSHEQKESKTQATHFVNIIKNSKLHQIIHSTRIKTNTTHHQAVKDLGKTLTISAFADDGIIEAIEGKRVLGIQWHPEILKDRASQNLLRGFVFSTTQSK